MKIRKLILIFLIAFLSMNKVSAQGERFGFVVRGYNSYDAPTSVSFSEDSYQMIFRGDTRDDEMNGIGVFEGNGPSDVILRLREKTKNTSLIEGRFMPVASVDKDVKLLFNRGQRQCKLDAKIYLLPNDDGRLLVIVNLLNSGKERFVMENPVNWDGESNRILGSSNIAILGKSVDKSQSEDIGFYLDNIGGRQLIKSGTKTSGENLILEPGQAHVIEFLTFPGKPIKKGNYNAAANISIRKIIEPEILKGVVEFSSLTSQIVFSRH